VWYPIIGEYDSYGCIENIIEDDNTKAIEEFYGLKIQEIVNIVCSNRKDDGYDNELLIIKKEKSDDYDPSDDYGNPQYQERYLELLTYSGMWIRGDLYKKLNENHIRSEFGLYEEMNLGISELLISLGFTQGPIDNSKERYNIPFTKDDLTIYSDGTWLNVPNRSIYTLKGLKKYCNENNVNIDITPISQNIVGQIYDLIIPKLKMGESKHNPFYPFYIRHIDKTALFYLLKDDFNDNPMSNVYLKYAQEGKLKQNMLDFWNFDKYMFANGRFYDIIGTSPQDGEHKLVYNLLTIAKDILEDEIKELYEDEDEDEDYEDDDAEDDED
jgi:hypothetical protein